MVLLKYSALYPNGFSLSENYAIHRGTSKNYLLKDDEFFEVS
jgi:hypothetical protein